MKCYAIIPARGGSKRLPGKNIRMLGGKPLINYTIDACTGSRRLSGFLVSTDDENIVKHVQSAGVLVPFLRPKDLARDTSPIIDVIQHALSYIENNVGHLDAVILLQPTSPFRTSRHIDEAIDLYRSSGADTVVSVRELSEHPYWCWTITDNTFQPYFSKDKMSMGRENLPPAFIENGAIFVIKRSLVAENSIYGDKIVPYLMDQESSTDIDTLDDLLFAEFLLKKERDNSQ